jgi:hypothetical protein
VGAIKPNKWDSQHLGAIKPKDIYGIDKIWEQNFNGIALYQYSNQVIK